MQTHTATIGRFNLPMRRCKRNGSVDAVEPRSLNYNTASIPWSVRAIAMFFIANAMIAIILIGVIATAGAITPIYINFVSHVLLSIFSESALGADEIAWPDDHWNDRWWKPAWCVAAVAVCTALSLPFAVGFFLVAIPMGLAALAVGLSVLFPMGLLSSLFAPELLGPLHGEAYLAAFRRPGAWLIAWLWGTPLAAAALACFALTAVHSPNWVIGMGPLVPFAVVLFARAWGCFAWLATSGKHRKKSRTSSEVAPSAKAHAVDPWAIPESLRDEEAAIEDEAPEMDVEEWKEPLDEEPEDEWSPNKKPYAIGEDLPMANPKEVVQLEKHYADRRKVEKELDAKTSRYDRKRPTFGKAMGSRIPAILKRSGVPAALATLAIFSWIEFGLIAAIIWLVRLV